MAMSKRQKVVQLLDKLYKSKDFKEIGELREEISFLLDKIEEDKVRRWLKQDAKKNGEIKGIPFIVNHGKFSSVW